jgi:predicted nucleic acid-binding protein
MKYLLDVNALIALGIFHHAFHTRVMAWTVSQKDAPLLTCSITELGFVRVAAQVPDYGFTVEQAQILLNSLKTKNSMPLAFLPDGIDISQLPAWVKTPRQTTDGHLLQLASANGALLATLDERIPGAYLIPGTVSNEQ